MDSRTILLTGGGSGIGRVTAQTLARDGLEFSEDAHRLTTGPKYRNRSISTEVLHQLRGSARSRVPAWL